MKNLIRLGNQHRRAALAIINEAAQAYRGVIPEDRWHDPYMSADELDREIAGGVDFWGYEHEFSTSAASTEAGNLKTSLVSGALDELSSNSVTMANMKVTRSGDGQNVQ